MALPKLDYNDLGLIQKRIHNHSHLPQTFVWPQAKLLPGGVTANILRQRCNVQNIMVRKEKQCIICGNPCTPISFTPNGSNSDGTIQNILKVLGKRNVSDCISSHKPIELWMHIMCLSMLVGRQGVNLERICNRISPGVIIFQNGAILGLSVRSIVIG